MNAYLIKQFLPEGVHGWQILHSLSDSIRNFQGWKEGGTSKRKKKTDPPRIKNTKWTVTFDPRYSTPLWEFQRTPDDSTELLMRRPEGDSGTDLFSNLQCVAGHGVLLWKCSCQSCEIIRRLVAMSNPHVRSVMSRREEQRSVLTSEQYADFQCLVDQAMQRVDARDVAE